MKGKITLLGQIRRFMHVQWWNHGFGKMMGGVVMVAVYSVTKSVVLWQWPTTFFFKYERGLLACIGFYVLLQLLKQPPTVKGCLKDLNALVGHSRASTYWQFSQDESVVTELLRDDCKAAFDRSLEPMHHYMHFEIHKIILAVILFIVALVLQVMPSESHFSLDEKKAYNAWMKATIAVLEEAEKKENIEDENKNDLPEALSKLKQACRKLDVELLKDLEKSYSPEESLELLAAYNEDMETLLEDTKKYAEDFPVKTQQEIMDQLEEKKEGIISTAIRDALDPGQQEARTEKEGSEETAATRLTELISQEKGTETEKNARTLDVASEAMGSSSEDSQNGQGGSGQAYSEASDHIDQKTLFRTDSESLETGHENSAFHVTGIGGEETHLTLGKDVEAMNTLQTDSKSSSMSITLDERTITIPSGIPENRLELIRAYYEGE